MSTTAINKTITEYEKVWYFADFWPGEYPPRFSVLQNDVVLMGRAEMRLSAPQNVKCPVPMLATFSPWNDKRNQADNLLYRTVAEVITVTMTKAVKIWAHSPESGETNLDLKAGDTLELLIYQGEGFALFRHQDNSYSIDSSVLHDSAEFEENSREYDTWLNVPAENGERGWVLLRDALATEGVTDSIGIDVFGVACDLLYPQDLTLEGITFISGGAELTQASEQILEELTAKFFLAYEFVRQTGGNADHLVFEIGGHTDSVGSSDSNQRLSHARAKAVADYFAERTGLDQQRIRVVGYGESRPIADNETAEGREANRRVDLKVLSS